MSRKAPIGRKRHAGLAKQAGDAAAIALYGMATFHPSPLAERVLKSSIARRHVREHFRRLDAKRIRRQRLRAALAAVALIALAIGSTARSRRREGGA